MSRRPKRLAAVGAAAALFWLGSLLTCPVLAAESSVTHQVEVYVAACGDPPYDPGRFVELLRVELAALHVDALATSTQAPAEAQLGEGVIALAVPVCERTAQNVDLSVARRGSSTRLERRVELSDIAFEARARTLAIAAAELYRSALADGPAPPAGVPTQGSSAEPPKSVAVSAAPAPAAAPPSQPSSPSPPVAPEVEAPAGDAWSLELGFVGRSYPSERSALVGGDLAARIPVAHWLSVRAGGALDFGESTLPFDDANPITSNVALGMALGHVELLARSRGPLFLELGPRLDVGYGWVERRLGDPVFRAAGALADLGLAAAVRAPLAPRWPGFVSLYVGHSLGGVALEAASGTPGATSSGFAGVLFEAAIGIAFQPSVRR